MADGNHEKVPIKAKSSSNSLDLVTTRKVYDPEYFKLVFDEKYLDLDVSDESYFVSKIPVDNKKVFNKNEVHNDLIMNINRNQNELNKILVNNNDHLLLEDIGYYRVPLDTKDKITEEKESKEIDRDISFRIIPGFPKFNKNIYHLNYRKMNDPVNITEDSSNDVTENKPETTIEESYNEKYKTGHDSAIKDFNETDTRINKENNEQFVNKPDKNGYIYYDRVIPGIPDRKMKDEIPNTRIISRQHIEAIDIQDLRQELLNHLLDYIINIVRKDKADNNSEARMVEKLRDENSSYLEVVVLSDNIFEKIPHMS
ncbi:hypothetical protein K1T71_015177 [Dendrolimus kikuchii]|nr:hypothetical protein K1T71_015177 [Dendrolimus kikuchii]